MLGLGREGGDVKENEWETGATRKTLDAGFSSFSPFSFILSFLGSSGTDGGAGLLYTLES